MTFTDWFFTWPAAVLLLAALVALHFIGKHDHHHDDDWGEQ